MNKMMNMNHLAYTLAQSMNSIFYFFSVTFPVSLRSSLHAYHLIPKTKTEIMRKRERALKKIQQVEEVERSQTKNQIQRKTCFRSSM
jgi:hypothetical protein